MTSDRKSRFALCHILHCYGSMVVLASLGHVAGDSLGPSGGSSTSPGPPCLHNDTLCSSSSSVLSSAPESNGIVSLHPLHQERQRSLPGGSSDSPNIISSYYTRKESDQETTEDLPEEGERVLTCIFSSVPLIGGKWLTDAARRIFRDEALLEASLGFLEGGELIESFIDLGSRSTASRLLKAVGSCFDSENFDYGSEPYSKHFETPIDHDNDTQNHLSNSTESERAGRPGTSQLPHSRTVTSSPNLRHHRRRRWLIQQGGNGSDSLIGFNLLGLLVVGALITYLVYLLI